MSQEMQEKLLPPAFSVISRHFRYSPARRLGFFTKRPRTGRPAENRTLWGGPEERKDGGALHNEAFLIWIGCAEVLVRSEFPSVCIAGTRPSCYSLVVGVSSSTVDLDGSTWSDVHLQTVTVHESHPDQGGGPAGGGPDRCVYSVPVKLRMVDSDHCFPAVGQAYSPGVEEGHFQFFRHVLWQAQEPVESGIYDRRHFGRCSGRSCHCDGDYGLVSVVYRSFNHGLS